MLAPSRPGGASYSVRSLLLVTLLTHNILRWLPDFWEIRGPMGIHTGCVSESGDFKNVMNSKCFHLFSFNTNEHNVYIKEFRFFHFKFHLFNKLTH